MKRIIIHKYGLLGNNIIEYMLALYLKSIYNDFKIYRSDPNLLSEFGLNIDVDKNENMGSSFKRIEIFKPTTDINKVVADIKTSKDVLVIIRYNLFNKHHFMPMLDTFRNLFGNKIDVHGFDARYIVIHVRLGDIAKQKTHTNYPIIPFSFHRYIIRKTKLLPVFIGQLDTGYITTELKKEFPSAIFVEGGNPLHDFECMRRSKNLSIAVSTFSFLAGFLSDNDTTIHMPVYGLFNREDRPELDYLVVDKRFHFYKFPRIRWCYSPEQINHIVSKEDVDYKEIKI